MTRRWITGSICWVATACLSADEGVDSSVEGAAALVLVRVRPHRPTTVKVIEPVEPGKSAVLASTSGDHHTYVLVYERPLSSYGLRVDGDRLVQQTGGVPLPPPARWLEASAERGVERREGLDTADASTARSCDPPVIQATLHARQFESGEPRVYEPDTRRGSRRSPRVRIPDIAHRFRRKDTSLRACVER